MSELDHLRKKPPDDDGCLLLDTKDRRLKGECQECGVKFYIGPEETSQQASKRRAALRRSINAAKKKKQRVAEKGGEREQVRLQKQALRQDLLRQTETDGAREARLQADRANKESKREAETEDAWTLRLQDQAHRQDLHRHAETEDARTLRLQGQDIEVLGHCVCMIKLTVKIVFVRQRPKMLEYRACRDKHNVNSL